MILSVGHLADEMMDVNTYQQQAWTTAIYPDAGQGVLTYPVLLLVGEVAELRSRQMDLGQVGGPDPKALQKELGDVLWALAATATELGISLANWFEQPESIPADPIDHLQQSASHLAGLVSKEFRDGLYVDRHTRVQPLGYQLAAACQGVCLQYSWDLTDIMTLNIAKLKDRQMRGVLQGEGDER